MQQIKWKNIKFEILKSEFKSQGSVFKINLIRNRGLIFFNMLSQFKLLVHFCFIRFLLGSEIQHTLLKLGQSWISRWSKLSSNWEDSECPPNETIVLRKFKLFLLIKIVYVKKIKTNSTTNTIFSKLFSKILARSNKLSLYFSNYLLLLSHNIKLTLN